MEEEFLESEVVFSGDYNTAESDNPDLPPELSHRLIRKHPSSSNNNCIEKKNKKRVTSTPIYVRPGYNHSRSKEVAAHHSQPYDDRDEDAGFDQELLDHEASVITNGDRGKMVPPHVIAAKRIAAKMTTSVYAASGRALRGRDLCQVRNSILRMTGFLET